MPFAKGHLTRPRTRPITDFKQARQIQHIAHSLCKKLEDSAVQATNVKTRCSLAKALRDAVSAWDTARDAVRILKGKGLPTRVPEKLTRRKLAPSSYQIIDVEDLPANVKRLTETTQPTQDNPSRPVEHVATQPEAPEKQNASGIP
jgi:hypothetical protein